MQNKVGYALYLDKLLIGEKEKYLSPEIHTSLIYLNLGNSNQIIRLYSFSILLKAFPMILMYSSAVYRYDASLGTFITITLGRSIVFFYAGISLLIE